MTNKNKLTFSSAAEGDEANKLIVESLGSDLHIQQHGITGGNMKPEELIAIRDKITKARLATGRWIHDAMIAEGIDPNNKSSYNKEKVKFLKDVLTERWNKTNSQGKFINRPSEVQALNTYIKRHKTWGERFSSLNPFLWGGLKQRQKLMRSGFKGSSPYEFLTESESLLGGINKIGSTRYSANVDNKWVKKNLGANLNQLSQQSTNPYYMKDLDTYNTTSFNKETNKARDRYFRRTPILAEVNPLGYLYNISEDNPSYAGKIETFPPGTEGSSGTPSRLNYQKPNLRALSSNYTGEAPSGFEWAGGSVEGYSPPNKRWALMTKPEREAAKRRGLSILDFRTSTDF